MKKKKWMAFAGAALLLAGAGAWVTLAQGKRSTISPETLAAVSRGDLAVTVTATGRVQPLTKVDIKSRVAGQVRAVHVKEGQTVQKGQVLLSLEATDYERRLLEARADRAMAQAQLGTLRSGARPEEVAESRALLAQAQAQSALAKEEAARAEKAFQAGSLTPMEHSRSRAAAQQAVAALLAQESRLAKLQAGPRPQELAEARARLAKADVAVATAQDQLAATIIRAPRAGTVTYRNIEEGELVSQGAAETPPLLTIADLKRLVVESDINQVEIGKLAVGMAAVVRVDTLPGQTFTGRLHKIAAAAVAGRERDVQLFPIQTLVTGQGLERLRPGMACELDIDVKKRSGVLLLPIEAVLRQKGTAGRLTVVRRGANDAWVQETRTVNLGASNDRSIEVLSGAAEGEQVLIDPAAAKDNLNQF